MEGPRLRGHWSSGAAPHCGGTHKFLVAGRRYRVLAPFTDFDGHAHSSGETWEFLGYSFLPYEDGLSLFVSLDGRDEWHIRLQSSSEQQAYMLDHLDRFLAPDAAV